MSSLNSLFNRGLLGTKCKTSLTMAISRIKLLRNRRQVQLFQMRKEISQFLRTQQESIARIRVEHVIREQNILAAYEIIELFCEFILARVPVLDTQKTCPQELQEAVASLIFAAPRCSDVPELIQVKNLFTTKYGKEFVAAASELRPDTNVNRVIIEKLSVKAPSPELRLQVLKGIAQEHNLDWDSSNTEAEFNKQHEDLLNGLNLQNVQPVAKQESVSVPAHKDAPIVKTMKQSQPIETPPIPSLVTPNENPFPETKESARGLEQSTTTLSTADVMERARAAIASADRACAAAKAAAKLVELK